MTSLTETETFACHLAALPAASARHRIQAQLNRLRLGLLSHSTPVVNNISALHIADYQVYYATPGDAQILLLCIGQTVSQDDDLASALKLAAEVA